MAMVGYAPPERQRGPVALGAQRAALAGPVAPDALAADPDALAAVLAGPVVGLGALAGGGLVAAGIAAETAETVMDVVLPPRDSRVARVPRSRRSQQGRSPFHRRFWSKIWLSCSASA